jgi:hypothetical protein
MGLGRLALLNPYPAGSLSHYWLSINQQVTSIYYKVYSHLYLLCRLLPQSLKVIVITIIASLPSRWP